MIVIARRVTMTVTPTTVTRITVTPTTVTRTVVTAHVAGHTLQTTFHSLTTPILMVV